MYVYIGLVLSMAVDPFENWAALGTSLGYHVVWDMRFQLPIRHWQHSGHGGKSKSGWDQVGSESKSGRGPVGGENKSGQGRVGSKSGQVR